MESKSRDVIIGDNVSIELIGKYNQPIVCSRKSPVMEGFVPTSFNDLGSVISSVSLIIDLTQTVGTVAITPITNFRSDWKYYNVQYGLELIAEFSEILVSPCIFVSKLNEILGVKAVTIYSDTNSHGIIDSIRDEFIFEYMSRNHPDFVLKKAKI